jgi:hypothetical protein
MKYKKIEPIVESKIEVIEEKENESKKSDDPSEADIELPSTFIRTDIPPVKFIFLSGTVDTLFGK